MAESVPLVLGTAKLSQPYGLNSRSKRLNLNEQIDLIRLAEASGFSAIDTAPKYGSAEETIGLSATSLEIHTKCNPNRPLKESLQRSKNLLRREILDVVYIHESLQRGGDGYRKLRGLAEQIGQGVDKVGASVYEIDEFLLALEVPEVSVIQVPVNLLDRRFADFRLLDRAADLGKQVVARSVFLQGLLVSDYSLLPNPLSTLRPYLEKVEEVARLTGLSRIRIALSYVTQLVGLSAIIVGVSSASQLKTVVSEFSHSDDEEVLDLVEQFEAAPWGLVDPRKWHVGGG